MYFSFFFLLTASKADRFSKNYSGQIGFEQCFEFDKIVNTVGFVSVENDYNRLQQKKKKTF